MYYAFNIHLGVGLEHRLKACEQLKEWAHEIIAKNPEAKIVVTGDFNTFPDWGGPEQINTITTYSMLDEVTKTLILPNMQPIATTFIAFPVDFAANERRLREEVLKLPSMNHKVYLWHYSAITKLYYYF